MKSKSRLRTWIQNALWMVLVLLCVGLILRGFSAWLAMIESGYVPGNPVDFSDLVATMAAHLLENWQSEIFPFLGQVIGLACLLHVAPLQTEPLKRSHPANSHSVRLDNAPGGAEVIN